MKSVYIQDLEDLMQGCDVFILKELTVGKTSAGKQFISVILEDKTGSLQGVMWDASDNLIKELRRIKSDENGIVKVDYKVGMYKEKKQLTINDITSAANEDVNLSLLLKSSPLSQEYLKSEIKETFEGIQDTFLKNVLAQVFKIAGNDFFSYPAATLNHHDFVSGLAQHTVEMCKLAKAVGQIFPEINLDMLLSGVLIHDIGKLYELSGPVAAEYTIEGQLMGHIAIMSNKIGQICEGLIKDDNDKEKALLLQHMLLSHHGKLEFGSPILPKTLEAQVLSMIDDMDAKINMILKFTEDVEEGSFSEKIFGLENRKIYKPYSRE